MFIFFFWGGKATPPSPSPSFTYAADSRLYSCGECMVAFKIRLLLLSSKERSPYRRVSVICKSFLSEMFDKNVSTANWILKPMFEFVLIKLT